MSAFQADFIRNGVGNPTIDQYDTSSQFLKSTNYTKPKQTNMQVLDEDYAQTYQKLKDNLAAVLESEKLVIRNDWRRSAYSKKQDSKWIMSTT